MTNISKISPDQLLNSDEAELPKCREDKDIIEYMKIIFDDYERLINRLDVTDPIACEIYKNKGLIRSTAKRIIDTISLHREGAPHLAYSTFAEIASDLDEFFENISTLPIGSNASPKMFRIRLGNMRNYKRADMFHIPYDKRFLVSTQRYSIPGLPAVYLSGSIWCCWEEMNRPAFSEIHVSEFRPATDQTYTLLDFGYRPAVVASIAREYNPTFPSADKAMKMISSYAICWPLIAACSLIARDKRDEENCNFVHEYIIPQLLLQWVKNNREWDGIRYFSTKVSQYIDNPNAAANFVFPSVSHHKFSGYCDELSKKFTLTPPVPWSLLVAIGNFYTIPSYANWKMPVAEGVNVSYMQTDFLKAEAHLSDMPFEPI